MTENQHYYYLKLKDSFFEKGVIRILGDGEKGGERVVTYLRLCLLSLEHRGLLMLNEKTPYTAPLLAKVLNLPEEEITETLESLLSLGLLDRLEDGRYYVSDIELYVGKSSTEGDRKRKERARLQSQPEAPKEDVFLSPDKCPPISEIKKEIDLERKQEYAPAREDGTYPQAFPHSFSTSCGYRDPAPQNSTYKPYPSSQKSAYKSYPSSQNSGYKSYLSSQKGSYNPSSSQNSGYKSYPSSQDSVYQSSSPHSAYGRSPCYDPFSPDRAERGV